MLFAQGRINSFTIEDYSEFTKNNFKQQGDYKIEGKIYLDAYTNNYLDIGEPGLVSVTVNLLNTENQIVERTKSDTEGNYQFKNLPTGKYHVAIEVNTKQEDLNETLSTYFTGFRYVVYVDVTDFDQEKIDFSFALNQVELNRAFTEGELVGKNHNLGYWVAKLSEGLNNGDKAEMQPYLESVKNFYLADPFILGNGQEFEDAYALLVNRTPYANGLLKKQLLVAEFNHFAGGGLQDQLQVILLQWGEYMANHFYFYNASDLTEAKNLFVRFNNLGQKE